MKKRFKVRELMQRERLRGEIVEFFHLRNTGMIHGEEGYDVAFNQESLDGGTKLSRTEPRPTGYLRDLFRNGSEGSN